MRDSRTVPRYFLTPALDGYLDDQPVSVVDIGLKGVRIELTSPLEPGGRLKLLFASINVPVQVLWCDLDWLDFGLDEDHYLAGVAFEEKNPLIEELIGLLLEREAAIPIEDQRSANRYRIAAPLTGSFGEIAPVSILDISVRGVRIAAVKAMMEGSREALRFQVDDESGPINAPAEVMWCKSADEGGFEAGLNIVGEEAQLRRAITRLCVRNEARIDVDSLRQRFDALRLAARRPRNRRRVAV